MKRAGMFLEDRLPIYLASLHKEYSENVLKRMTNANYLHCMGFLPITDELLD